MFASVQTDILKQSISSPARPIRGSPGELKTLADFPDFLLDQSDPRSHMIAELGLGNLPQVGFEEFSVALTYFADAGPD